MLIQIMIKEDQSRNQIATRKPSDAIDCVSRTFSLEYGRQVADQAARLNRVATGVRRILCERNGKET
ncbi:hypothetical protein HYFRA_00008977 [Hymenoscyphus fraxineus]|uniref:Uncharacterized protein n=1 Tax=Hymenoscyphus fraxineus TaxID=746836 RepID=A0A9N9PRS8_9HELO|nr:hypothetical protein HYFRA_00008977 [Hymenoscyphus fraxineus]